MASLTITVPDAQVPRVQAAVGKALELGQDATTDEVRQFLVDKLIQLVRSVEKREAADAAFSSVTDIGATT
jgi:hypothetical protein